MSALGTRFSAWRRDRAASMWVVRMHGPRSDYHEEGYRRWRNADPRNAAAYDSYDQLWSIVGQVNPARVARQIEHRRSRPALGAFGITVAAAVACVIIAAGSVMIALHARTATPVQQIAAARERRAVQMSDGSLILLTPDTHIALDPDDARRVMLANGGIRVLVAHDPARPFRLLVGDRVVRALGTIFDVERADRQFRVTLIEGSIEVSSKHGGVSDARRLNPGDTVGAKDRSALTAMSAIAGWSDAPIWFDGVPLAMIVRAASVAGTGRPIIIDPQLGSRPITGRFRISDREALARKLAEALGVSIATTGSTLRLLHRGKIQK